MKLWTDDTGSIFVTAIPEGETVPITDIRYIGELRPVPNDGHEGWFDVTFDQWIELGFPLRVGP